jgi:hypothetical protein
MIIALKEMFETPDRTKRFNVAKYFVECKMAEGVVICPHVIKRLVIVHLWENMVFHCVKIWPMISFCHLFDLAMGTSFRTTICMR